MDYTPIATGFAPQRRVRPDFEDFVRFGGKAPKGLYSYKLGLEVHSEILREHPVQAVRHGELLDEYFQKPFAGAVGYDGRLRRRAFDVSSFYPNSHPQEILWGKDVSVSVFTGHKEQRAVRTRNRDCDTLCFVHRMGDEEGVGSLDTDFGELSFGAGDFIYLPRGSTYRFPEMYGACILMYEFRHRLMKPYHYWMDGYPFSDTDLISPDPIHIVDEPDGSDEYLVLEKRHGNPSRTIHYPFSPFDAVAWEGVFYPFVLNLQDIKVLSSPNTHIDPTTLTVFVTEDGGASMQAFLPRWVYSLPYSHQNDVDELLFNHSGYSARPNIKDGFITFHPAGAEHGPDLYAQRAQDERGEVGRADTEWRDETAVMLESRSELFVQPLLSIPRREVKGYDTSWNEQYRAMQNEGEK